MGELLAALLILGALSAVVRIFEEGIADAANKGWSRSAAPVYALLYLATCLAPTVIFAVVVIYVDGFWPMILALMAGLICVFVLVDRFFGVSHKDDK